MVKIKEKWARVHVLYILLISSKKYFQIIFMVFFAQKWQLNWLFFIAGCCMVLYYIILYTLKPTDEVKIKQKWAQVLVYYVFWTLALTDWQTDLVSYSERLFMTDFRENSEVRKNNLGASLDNGATQRASGKAG